MAYSRGRYGVEYNPSVVREESPWARRIVALVLLSALVSLAVSLYRRFSSPVGNPEVIEIGVGEAAVSPAPTPPEIPPSSAEAAAPRPADSSVARLDTRPVKVRNLLMRLAEAEKRRDTELAIETIEILRALPGSPAADLDDALARRLGVLNSKRLWVMKSRLWTTEVTVRRGDSAERLAAAHGSTLASLEKLNGELVKSLKAGMKIKVMEHPRFSLNVYRMTKTVDLWLNGKFFRRFYLKAPVKGAVGSYTTPARLRPFLAAYGIEPAPADLVELETLLPKGVPVVISEFR